MSVSAPHDSTCLFLDVDGSLIDIAARPEQVVVPPGLVRDLVQLDRGFDGAVALVSGRSIEQLDGLFSPWRFRASGVHGAQMRLNPDGPVAHTAPPLSRDVWDDLQAVLSDFSGTLVEDKRFSFAVHYRAVPEAGPALGNALKALAGRHVPLRLMPGHAVFELKPPGIDKGEAVRRFLASEPFAGRLPIFVGDDVTDLPGFAASIAAGGRGYAVGRHIPGTTGTFADPSAVRSWVAELAATEAMHA